MGAMGKWLREDDRTGRVDLSCLALPEDNYMRPERISFLTKTGLWYILMPLPETQLTDDKVIYPVRLERANRSGPYENILDAASSIPREIIGWATEGRHFPHIGHVALLNIVVCEGDNLNIDGRNTGPLDSAWVTERIDPSTGETGNSGYGRVMSDGSMKLIMTRTLANF